MKIGFQTIVWWPFTDGIEYMLDVIAAAGFKGVEFKQRPRQQGTNEQLPDELGDIQELLRLLQERGLELLGLAGGSLGERMDYCRSVRPQYLYIEGWDEDTEQLYEESKLSPEGEFTLALHPHVFEPTQSLRAALQLLDEHPYLKFLPDTAHLTIAGDLKEAVSNLPKYKDRIAAVHLKDWTPEFGWSVHRYARGFVELGDGDVDLKGVLKVLDSIKYRGWLVVEQDYTKTDPSLSTSNCAEWLAQEGLLTTKGKKLPSRVRKASEGSEVVDSDSTSSLGAQARFLEAVVSAGWQDIRSCYDSIARAFLGLLDCELVTFWTCSPAHDLLNLVAFKDREGRNLNLKNVLNYRNALSGDTIERQRIQHFDLTDPDVVSRFGLPDLIDVLETKWMTSIPVFNPWNPNHVRLVVNIFHESREGQINDSDVFRLGIAVGHATSSALDEVGATGTISVNAIVAKGKRVKGFVEELTGVIADAMDCDEVAILLRNPVANKFDRIAYYGGGKGSTAAAKWHKAMEKNILLLLNKEERFIMPRDWWKVIEEVERLDLIKRRACTATPFVTTNGTFLGFVWCCGKQVRGQLGISEEVVFSDDDDAILEAIVQATIPHLEVLAAQERREKALGRMTHELKVPIVAIRGATQLMMRTPSADTFFHFDYPGDIWSWSELMGRLIDNADVARYSSERMEIKPLKTRLLAHVIAPAIRQAGLVLKERGFSSRNIEYDVQMFRQFPEMWLDRNRFQQVLFNLLSNAVKFAYDDPNAFVVEIDGDKDESGFKIWFRDWGTGIKTGMEEIIFEEGVRSEEAVKLNVAGQGLGLWVVRQIVERHGGDVSVTQLSLPTTVQISLPYSIRLRPPS